MSDSESDCGPGSESPKDEKKVTEESLLGAGTPPTASIVTRVMQMEFCSSFCPIFLISLEAKKIFRCSRGGFC